MTNKFRVSPKELLSRCLDNPFHATSRFASLTRTTLDGRTVDIVGPKIWNSLHLLFSTLIQPVFTLPSNLSYSGKSSSYVEVVWRYLFGHTPL